MALQKLAKKQQPTQKVQRILVAEPRQGAMKRVIQTLPTPLIDKGVPDIARTPLSIRKCPILEPQLTSGVGETQAKPNRERFPG